MDIFIKSWNPATKSMSPLVPLKEVIEAWCELVTKGKYPLPLVNGFLSTLTLLPSVGCKDKKGVEICVGDIVKDQFQNQFGSFSDGVGRVIFCEPSRAFQIERKGETGHFNIGIDCEVIGTYSEHPELYED